MTEKLIRDIEDVCSWYKSKSIVQGNPYYEKCHKICDGYQTNCTNYIKSDGRISMREYYERKGWLKR